MYLLDAILHSVNLKVPRRASSERHSSEQSIQICFWLETFCGKNRLWLEVSVREDSKRRPWHHRGWWDWRWIDCEMLFDVRKYAISYYSISYYSIVTIARRTHCVLHRLLKGETINDERYLHQESGKFALKLLSIRNFETALFLERDGCVSDPLIPNFPFEHLQWLCRRTFSEYRWTNRWPDNICPIDGYPLDSYTDEYLFYDSLLFRTPVDAAMCQISMLIRVLWLTNTSDLLSLSFRLQSFPNGSRIRQHSTGSSMVLQFTSCKLTLFNIRFE